MRSKCAQNVTTKYAGSVRFKSRPKQRLFRQTLRGFSQSPQADS